MTAANNLENRFMLLLFITAVLTHAYAIFGDFINLYFLEQYALNHSIK